MSVVLLATGVTTLLAVIVGLALTRRQLRVQFGPAEGGVQFASYSRRWLPIIVALAALPLVPLALIRGADIETLRRISWALWTLLAAATAWATFRVLTRQRRLGPALVVVPAARWMRVASIVLALMALVVLLLWVATFSGKPPSNPPGAPVFLAWAWLHSRCTFEIRPGGICNAFREWRWANVAAWAWEPAVLRPMLRIKIGRWPVVHWEVPEGQRAAVNLAFTQYAGAKD